MLRCHVQTHEPKIIYTAMLYYSFSANYDCYRCICMATTGDSNAQNATLTPLSGGKHAKPNQMQSPTPAPFGLSHHVFCLEMTELPPRNQLLHRFKLFNAGP
jgi:hypothetical protein